MGARLSSIFSTKRKIRCFVLGLHGAGKTSALHAMGLGQVVTTTITPGWDVQVVDFENKNHHVTFTSWDVGGSDRLTPLWNHYFEQSAGCRACVIFIVDATDRARIVDARHQLYLALEIFQSATSGANTPDGAAILLVLANKLKPSGPAGEQPGAMSAAEITEALQLSSMKDRLWHVQPCSHISGHSSEKAEGLFEGIKWMTETLRPSSAVRDQQLAERNRRSAQYESI